MADNTPLLEITDLNISYYTRAGEIPAVIDFSLTLNAGESVGLVGESGCGKSTVAMAIMQYMGSNGGIKSGSIKFKGRDLTTMSESELQQLRGSQIAMIYQEPMAALNPSMLLGRQLMEVPLIHEQISELEARQRTLEMLDAVRLPDPERVFKAYPHQISGGQQQRVVIAMALLSNPALLLLDEPTTALDVTVEAGIVKLIAEISQRFGTAQIFISHNLGLILETCQRVCVMYSGESVEEGEINTLFERPLHPYTHGLFGCIPLPTADKNARPLKPIVGQLPLPHERPQGCNFGPRCEHFVAGRCDDIYNIPNLPVPDSPGHKVRCVRWEELLQRAESVHTQPVRDPLALGEEVLNVQDMKKYYPVYDRSIGALLSGTSLRYIKANEALDFTARRGETVAIVGESGCGKSTFAKVLMGLETVTAGRIDLGGENIGAIPVQQRPPERLASMQMVFQNPSDTLNPSLTVGAQIGRVIKKFGLETDSDTIRDRVMQLLDTVKLPRDFYYRRPRQLSGGQKQRVGIARAFAGNPELVIADEPVSALDVSVAAAVTELLMDIQREHQTTLLFISHDLSVVRYLADRVVVMYLGQIMEAGTTEQLFNPPYHPYSEALLSAVPIADPKIHKREIVLDGPLPSALNPPEGCPFATRCHRKIGAICDQQRPPAQKAVDGHHIACHIPLEELRQVEPVMQMPSQQPQAEAVGEV